jgi:hypothetical protein
MDYVWSLGELAELLPAGRLCFRSPPFALEECCEIHKNCRYNLPLTGPLHFIFQRLGKTLRNPTPAVIFLD